ncbi:MAG: universal stress protein [Rhodospirillales bacterium]|nr:universal stress protein [Rhodospirillales bacterium]
MAIRTILVPLSGGATSEAAVETAAMLALRFRAHLEALHVRGDPRDALPMLGQDISTPVTADLIEMAIRESDENAARAKAAFEAQITRHGLVLQTTPTAAGPGAAATAEFYEETGDPAELVPTLARLSDLVVLGQSGRVVDRPFSDTLEQTVMNGGRPVLLSPAKPVPTVGESIAIAWNDSPQAARAVSGALPFLAQARSVHVMTASSDEGTMHAAELIAYLAWHGVTATSHRIEPIEGVGNGELLLSTAHDLAADLLVMGGYGRAPWREMIFGGATRKIVGTSRMPILLSH